MNTKTACCLLLVVFLLGACTPAPTSKPTSTAGPPLTAVPADTAILTATLTATPTPFPWVVTVPSVPGIKPYSRVTGLSFASIQEEIPQALLQSLWFNRSTRWSAGNEALAAQIMEWGKNPGLGVRGLHRQGITGKGVTVAIIDASLLLDHPEYAGKVIQYLDIYKELPLDEGSMHGPAVTSLLAGETTGTAPGARLFFVATPSLNDAQPYALAINWLVSENEKLPAGQKIRVVSVSSTPSGPGSDFENPAAWDAAVQRAAAAGILVLDNGLANGITAPCYLDLENPDDPGACYPGWPSGAPAHSIYPNLIYVPASRRTTAEEYQQGEYSYQYTGEGGASWEVPYVSGVLALGWQVRPELTNDEILKLLFDSAHVRPDGARIIDPPAFIEAIKALEVDR